MTHKGLQAILKEYRELGYTLQVKLNATTQLLQAEYDRIQSELVREKFLQVPDIEASCELTCDVGLPVIVADEIDADDFELQTAQYCEMVGADIDDFQSVQDAREFLDAFAPWTIEDMPAAPTTATETFHAESVPMPFGIIAIALLLAFAEIFKNAVDKAIDSMSFSELAQFFIELRKSIFPKSQFIN